MLEAGVPLTKSITTIAKRMRDSRCRRTLREISVEIERGHDLETTLKQYDRYFPELFVDMVHIGEETGTLPEVLTELGKHYDRMTQLRRDFISAITPSIIQLFAAIGIVSILILILGMIPNATDTLGWGLMGEQGAVTFLSYSLGSIAAIVGAYLLLVRGFGMRRSLHGFFLAIPVVGKCMRSFAIARFSWAYYLTQQAGMPVFASLDASLRATSNGAFIGVGPMMRARIAAGDELSEVMSSTGLFPEEYVEIVIIGETTGTVPEKLEQMSPRFEEEARRSLKTMSAAISWLVWLIVAGFIVFIIFSIMLTYMGHLGEALKEANR
jgi:type IV pilus assembly protein PilC